MKIILPTKNKKVTYDNPRKKYTTVYFGLPLKLAKRITDSAKKQKTTESAMLRCILGRFLKNIQKIRLKRQVCLKTSIQNMKTKPRTIWKWQDEKIRRISEETGRSISALVREAIYHYYHSK